MDKHYKKETIIGHLGDHEYRHKGSVVPPIHMNSLFLFEDVETCSKAFESEYDNYIYTRGNNPTVELLEKKIAALEKGEACRAFGSGMAAISAAIMSCVKQGDHIVTINTVYGPAKKFMTEYLKKFGIQCTMVNGSDYNDFVNATQENTTLIYLESPSSYLMRIQDLKRISEFAKSKGIKTIVDNSWATPIFQNPIDFGIDLVVHSATKYISGHSDVVAGLVIGSQAHIAKLSTNEHALFGGILSPFDAWLLTKGLRTLSVRIKHVQSSAAKVAAFLEKHPKVKYVLYPGLESHPQYELAKQQMSGNTGLMTFCVKDFDAMETLVNSLELFGIGVSWGGFESLVMAPGITMGRKNRAEFVNTQFEEGMIRISIGLEDVDDLIQDLEQALNKI